VVGSVGAGLYGRCVTTPPASLSPSRAGDFVSCPLLFRYRTVDRLPEASSPDAVRGTLVHQVLEDVFDLPAAERTPERAHALLEPAWVALQERSDEAREVAGRLDEVPWLASAHEAVERWFTLEDPTRLEPAERESYVEAELASGLRLRGIIDRLDAAPDGALRVVDYKGLAVDTPLPTPSGWTTMGAVEVGDQLIGSDGRPTTVTVKSSVHEGRVCYRLRFRDGSAVVCDDVHLWRVVTTHRQRHAVEVLDTSTLALRHRSLIDQGRPGSMWIESTPGLVSERTVAVPIDPWLLGAWLGDGASRGGTLSVGASDVAEMSDLIRARWSGRVSVVAESTAYRVTPSRDPRLCAYGHDDWSPSPHERRRRGCSRESEHDGSGMNVGLTTLLRRAGLTANKHIPAVYLRASVMQRVDLLRGLMDTDGWWNVTRRRAGFTTTDDRLAADVIELLRSLGIAPSHFRKPYLNAVRPDRTWHVIEFTPGDFNPFSLPRKADAVADHVTTLQRRLRARRTIASVAEVDSVPTQCVAVDAADSLYLCGDGFIATHNTGRAPAEGYEARVLFQLRLYALILWRSRGVVAKRLQLVYLGGEGQVIAYDPDEADLVATERKVEAIWAAIQEARRTGEFEPRRGKQCDWCPHHAICPAWGGTALPWPVVGATPEPAATSGGWAARLRAGVRRAWGRVRRSRPS
jgi:RecB family exonuclease